MALASLALLLALQAPAAKPAVEEIGNQPLVVMPIDKHIDPHFDPNKNKTDGSFTFGAQEVILRLGEVSWEVGNSLYEGKPCKLFQGKSKWQLKAKGRNRGMIYNPTLYSNAWISPSGRLLKTETSYSGIGAPIQIQSIYKDDSIDMTIVEGRNTRQATLFPKFEMSMFDNLFKPLMRDGLIESEERELAFINPTTAAPVTVKVKVRSRFDGKLYFRNYQGYKFETSSPDSMLTITSMISRHGQMLQVTLPENTQAVAYLPMSNDDEKRWGKFQATFWDVPASKSQPNRASSRTLGVPVLITKPSLLLVPIPYAVAL